MEKTNKTAQLLLALTPLVVLMLLLWFNVGYVFGDDALSGSNQVILMLSAFVAAAIGIANGTKVEAVFEKIKNNVHDTTQAIFILILIGGLAGTWLIGGIVPAMIYYGLDLINVQFFLPTAVIISALVSLSTGSSWSTTATVGIALMGIGQTIGLNPAIVAGAVISGAYFGDKLSPLSDTTNLAPAMAGTDLFTHIRYMLYTTIPSLIISLILFTILGWSAGDAAMDAAQCIGCGACVAACPNGAANLFTGAKVTHLNLLPQGQAERYQRVENMVETMDEHFGSCTNHGECEAACPKEISIDVIALMNADYRKAKTINRKSLSRV